jgi:hypothetical protein
VAGAPHPRGPWTTFGLWPPPDTPPPADETSLWLTDPSVERLSTRIRDALTEVRPDEEGRIVEAWVPDIGYSVDQAAEVVTGLVCLAGRAREAGQELYCWSSL